MRNTLVRTGTILLLSFAACGTSQGQADPAPPSTTDPAQLSTSTTTSTTAEPTTTTTPETTTTTVPEQPGPVYFEPLSDESIYDAPSRYVNPGVVLADGDTFHMFSNAFSAWPSNISVRHLTSTDLVTWTPAAEDPLYQSDDVPFAPSATLTLGGGVIDGTWTLFFHTFSRPDRPGSIGRATAPGPNGPWSVDPEPLLEPGPEGSWDDLQVLRPSLVETSSGWLLFYQGVSSAGRASIGVATSTDGRSFTKLPDPVLTNVEWAEGWLDRPEVVATGDGFFMLFQGVETNGPLGAATSTDGIAWELLGDRPVFLEDVQTRFTFWQGELVATDGGIVFLLEAGGPRETNLYGWRVSVEQ